MHYTCCTRQHKVASRGVREGLLFAKQAAAADVEGGGNRWQQQAG